LQSSIQTATCYYQYNYSKAEAIPLSVLHKDTTSELADLSSHFPFLILNVKQRICEYQLLKSFGPTRGQGIEPRFIEYRADALTTEQ